MPKNKNNVIPLLTFEARIKRNLRTHLQTLGFAKDENGFLKPPDPTKETFRNLHIEQRNERLQAQTKFIDKVWPKLNNYFADGTDVVPSQITPRLELIPGPGWRADLFRLASLIWSVPVSCGYGRRMRFLVWDDSNGKLIGILGLGDPVFNLKTRDELIGWTSEDRKKRLVNIMDAYVLGAMPPYNSLLCGKLIACLIKTKEVRDLFAQKYNKSKGIISKKYKHASLAMVTTSSALGRSSIYNRLKLNQVAYLTSIGFTSGWGHFHIPHELFNSIRDYLKQKKHSYYKNNRFGDGPNWKLRAIRYALNTIGVNDNLLRHGISREVFICNIASNARRYLAGKSKKAYYRGLLSVEDVGLLAKERWIVPRAERYPAYQSWNREQILGMIMNKGTVQKNLNRQDRKVVQIGTR